MPRYWTGDSDHEIIPRYCWADNVEQARAALTAYAGLLGVHFTQRTLSYLHIASSQDPIGVGESRSFEPDFRVNKDA